VKPCRSGHVYSLTRHVSKDFPAISQAPPLIVKRMRRLRPSGEQGDLARAAKPAVLANAELAGDRSI